MQRPILLLGAVVASAALCISNLFACCVGTPFEWQVSNAKLIFAGTLTKAQPVKVAQGIETRYRFENVRYAKGEPPADSLILIQPIGCLGGLCISSSTEVQLNVGTRYVVFAVGGPERYFPMACGTGHPFVIRADSRLTENVMDVIAFLDPGHMVLVRNEPWDPRGHMSYGADGNLLPAIPPPLRSTEEQVQIADEAHEARLRNASAVEAEEARTRLRFMFLYPHQDPGTRVTEDEFLRSIAAIVQEVDAHPNRYKW